MPFKICLKIKIASFSVILPLRSMQSCRDPPLQYSSIISFSSSFSQTSQHLTRLGLLQMRIMRSQFLTNLKMVSLVRFYGFQLIFTRSMSFMATSCLVYSLNALQTVPKAPWPSYQKIEYLPTVEQLMLSSMERNQLQERVRRWFTTSKFIKSSFRNYYNHKASCRLYVGRRVMLKRDIEFSLPGSLQKQSHHPSEVHCAAAYGRGGSGERTTVGVRLPFLLLFLLFHGPGGQDQFRLDCRCGHYKFRVLSQRITMTSPCQFETGLMPIFSWCALYERSAIGAHQFFGPVITSIHFFNTTKKDISVTHGPHHLNRHLQPRLCSFLRQHDILPLQRI